MMNTISKVEAKLQPPVDISAWIANAIADTGCRVVYGGHGGALVPLVNAVCRHPDLTWVCARNEHDAATMAAAHAKMTGELGVVIATSGPGASNLTTGLMEAVMDRVSLLAITGLKPRAQMGYAEFQDINQSRLFAAAGVEWSKDATSRNAVIPLLRDAVATALTFHTCAHLAIPVDIQAAPSPLPLKHFCASHANLRLHTPALNPQLLDATAETLVGSPDKRRPRNIIAVGLRATYYSKRMSQAILDLAEALNAPVLTRLHAKGVVDESHPLSLGVIGVHGKPGLESAAAVVSSSDLVLSIGVLDETLLVCNLAGLQIRKVIDIDSDPMSLNTRFQAEHTVVGNIEETCRELTKRVEVLMAKMNKKRAIKAALMSDEEQIERVGGALDKFSYMMHNNPDVIEVVNNDHGKRMSLGRIEKEGINSILDESDALWDTLHNGDWRKLLEISRSVRYQFRCDPNDSEQNFCHPSDVLGALSIVRMDKSTDDISKNAAIAVDVGDVTLWTSLCLTLQGGSRTLYSERLGTMGYALNAGIAAILAKPGPAGAVVLAGDGGFQMTLNELSTFQQMKRPGDKLLCIVFDNQVLGRVVFGFNDAQGCEMIGPDYVALAKSYGGDGVRLEKSSDAEMVIRKAMATEGLFLVHVIVDPAVKADMATFHDSSIKVMNSG